MAVSVPPSRHRRLAESDLAPIEQRVEVSFNYRVLFTEDVFAVDNPVLSESLVSPDADVPTRFVCVVEAGVAGARPEPVGVIEAYARRNCEFISLVEAPLIVPGGEQVKNSPELVLQVQEAINRAAICRHSYVVAVGGGALVRACRSRWRTSFARCVVAATRKHSSAPSSGTTRANSSASRPSSARLPSDRACGSAVTASSD
jgi:hypothetical protein